MYVPCACLVRVLCALYVCVLCVSYVYCMCLVCVLCMSRVGPLCTLCGSCVCFVWLLCVSCVCLVCVLCGSCACLVWVLCVSCVCLVCALCGSCMCLVCGDREERSIFNLPNEYHRIIQAVQAVLRLAGKTAGWEEEETGVMERGGGGRDWGDGERWRRKRLDWWKEVEE